MGHIIRHAPSVLYGFDWFKGLPDEWELSRSEKYPQGHFKVIGDIDKHIRILLERFNKLRIINGLFENTLPEFLEQHQESCAFIHVDCDLYSSTHTVLTLLKDRIVPGTVIIFDEFYNYENYRHHEYRALAESGIEYKFIAHVANRPQAAIKCI